MIELIRMIELIIFGFSVGVSVMIVIDVWRRVLKVEKNG